MIEIKNKEDCCGCSACSLVCPKKCISLEADQEGFQYPVVNTDTCINCNRCVQVCPVLNASNERATDGEMEDRTEYTHRKISETLKPVQTFIAYNQNSTVRQASTSGGVFSVFAEYVISNNGFVYGAAFDKNFNIVHDCASTAKGFGAFRGSKYVQSDQAGVYSKVKSQLDEGCIVLYSGTPCQVVGLKRFLGKEYDNLITVDIFCHGVGSPKYWKKYLHFMEGKYKAPIHEIRFREKTYGYNSACMAVYFNNGKSSHRDHDADLYWTAFSKCYIFRPSCYACRFKTINHCSDFSIGDYWGDENLGSDFRAANGCTLLLVHSMKGQEIMKKVAPYIRVESIDLEKALLVNGGHMPSKLISSSPKPIDRDQFFDSIDHTTIENLVKKFMPMSLKMKVKCAVKPFLFKLGLLERIKRG